jgi:hypothetical protein
MKKILIGFVLLLVLLPVSVNAQETIFFIEPTPQDNLQIQLHSLTGTEAYYSG